MELRDGVPYAPNYDDVYFSAENGLKETRYVFMDGNNLPERWAGKRHFVVGETGFGTGLNFLECWQQFEETTSSSQSLTFLTVEKYPLSADEAMTALERWRPELGTRLDRLKEVWPYRIPGLQTIQVTPQIALMIGIGDVNDIFPQIEAHVDAWFLDGFTPSQNQDMWTPEIFQEMARLSKDGTTLATFTAAGFVRKGLEDSGFTIERRKGFAKKRHMTCGVFGQEGKDCSNSSPPKSALIVGGGLAGLTAGCELKRLGVSKVSVFERQAELAPLASGNQVGLVNPKLSVKNDVWNAFYTSGFVNVLHRYHGIQKEADISFRANGNLQLVVNDRKSKLVSDFMELSGWHDDHAKYLSCGEASEIAGVSVSQDALYLPDTGELSPQKLCNHLRKSVDGYLSSEVETIQKEGELWQVLDKEGTLLGEGEILILASGVETERLLQGMGLKLPLRTVGGQITQSLTPPMLKNQKANLCFGDYICAPIDGMVTFGATHRHDTDDVSITAEDHAANMQALNAVHEALPAQMEPCSGRAGTRTNMRDYFAACGAVDGQEGLYVSTAHGAHGTISTPLCAQILGALIFDRPMPVYRKVLQALNPLRFHL